MSSATTVHGLNSIFTKQLSKGDSIVANDQSRQVSFVLSDKALSIAEPFIPDIAAYTKYLFKKQTVVIQTKPIKDVLEYRMPKPEPVKYKEVEMRTTGGYWTYKKEKVKIKENTTHEEELNMRVKKISDKFCWA